ncbi:hypothetical protein LXL04_017302 [Taraxacum kok-saghyz]
MDVYMALKETGLSKYIMYLCFVLCSIQNIVLFLFRFTGIFESDESHNHDHEKQSEGPPHSGVLTRQFLEVTDFKDIQRKDLPESCAICLDEFGRDDKTRCLKNCIHIFHQSCLDHWMDHVHETCPICRTPILPHVYQDEYEKRFKVANSRHNFYIWTSSVTDQHRRFKTNESIANFLLHLFTTAELIHRSIADFLPITP